MEIKSKLPWPAGNLSNFAAYFFCVDGVLCASMEGFLQSLLTDDLKLQKEVCMMVGIEAKRFGLARIEDWKVHRKLWWQGREYDRFSLEYQELIDEAYESLFTQHERFRKALWNTGNEILTHSIGVSDPNEDILTEEEFCSRLVKMRSKIITLYQCICPCHEDAAILHFVPCCEGRCPECGLHIKFGMSFEHMRVCH